MNRPTHSYIALDWEQYAEHLERALREIAQSRTDRLADAQEIARAALPEELRP